MGATQITEKSLRFTPKFDENGLIPVVAQDARTGQVLMMAYMNREALALTIRTGYAVYFSRKRRKLWKKGEESGHIQKIEQILVDCDQDCLILKVTVKGGQCHVGYQSCFYRALKKGSSIVKMAYAKKLEFIAKKAYNPEKIYKKVKSGSINSP